MLFGSLKSKSAKDKCSPGRSVMLLSRSILWRVWTLLMQETQRTPQIVLTPLDSLHNSSCKCLNLKLNWLKFLISSKRTNSSLKSPSKSKMSTSSSLQSRNSSRKGTKTHWLPARSRMWLNFSLSTDNWLLSTSKNNRNWLKKLLKNRKNTKSLSSNSNTNSNSPNSKSPNNSILQNNNSRN